MEKEITTDNGIFTRFNSHLFLEIEQLADNKKVSRQDIIREAVSLYIQNYANIVTAYADNANTPKAG